MRKKKLQKTHKLKVIGYWLLVVVFLFLVGSGFRVFKGFKRAIWDGEGRVSFVMVKEEVWLVSFEPSKKEVVVLEIPEDTEIEATRGYGKYRIGAVYELGEIERKGGELLRESVQEYFGVPVKGWVKSSKSPPKARLARLAQAMAKRAKGGKVQSPKFKNEILSILRDAIFNQKTKTNFTHWDIFRLWWEIRKVSPYQIKFTRLEEIRALRSKVLVDGSRVWEVGQGQLDIWLQDNFYEPEIREENLTIGVINTTDHSGLANQVARIISNMGGRVIAAQSSKLNPFDRLRVDAEQGRSIKAQSSKCEVRSEKGRSKTFTVRKLVKAFGCQFVEEEESEGRVELTVLVGEEYWRMLSGD